MRLIAEFSLDGTPDLPNKDRYQHWASKSKKNKGWKLRVYEMCSSLGIAGIDLETAVLTFTRHSCKEPDLDNLCSSFKSIQDGLVYANVIRDDKRVNIGQPSYKWLFRPRKDGGLITIKIETKEECYE